MNPTAIPASWNTIAKAKRLYSEGKKAQAFGNVGKMKIKTLLTPKQLKTLQVAADFMNGMGSLWGQTGWNKEATISEAEAIFNDIIMKEE